MKKVQPDTKTILFWKLSTVILFYFLQGENENISWIFQHLISVGDVDSAVHRDGFCGPRFLSKKPHKQIQLIHYKGQSKPKQRKTKGGFSVHHSWATPSHKNTSPRVLVKHGKPHECCMDILAVFILTRFLCRCLWRWQGRGAYTFLQQSSGITLLYLLFKSQRSI